MPCPTKTTSPVTDTFGSSTPENATTSSRYLNVRPGTVSANERATVASTIGTSWNQVPLSPAGSTPTSASWLAR